MTKTSIYNSCNKKKRQQKLVSSQTSTSINVGNKHKYNHGCLFQYLFFNLGLTRYNKNKLKGIKSKNTSYLKLINAWVHAHVLPHELICTDIWMLKTLENVCMSVCRDIARCMLLIYIVLTVSQNNELSI